jgi:hypothetical protein
MKKVRLLNQAAVVVPVAAAATLATATGPAAATTIRPEITQEACATATKNWVHLHTTYHGSRCFGFGGIAYPDYFASKICPGNNSIGISWRSAGGSYYDTGVPPGYGWFYLGSTRDYVSVLAIYGWTGNGTC